MAKYGEWNRQGAILSEVLPFRFERLSLSKPFAEELIEYTVPAKPSSRLQRYRLTQAGIDFLKKLKER